MTNAKTIPQVDIKKLHEYVEKRLINKQVHPTEKLLIWNYTPSCQYDFAWDEYTRMCRGLITDPEGNIVARPFPKFHNIEEHEGADCKLPPLNWNQLFTCTRKEDGSLGILYPTSEGLKISTRGSFTSDQAIHATEVFYRKGYDKHNYSKDLTYLFEIVYPENRIVLDYKGMDDLILLEIVDTKDGEAAEWEYVCGTAKAIGCPVVPYMALSMENIQRMEEYYGQTNGSKEEGLVIRFNDGTRAKVKYAEYKRLHRLITGCSSRSIWENMREEKDLNELLERVPDEFNEWVKKTVARIKNDFEDIKRTSQEEFGKIFREGISRKEFALQAKDSKYSGILFKRRLSPDV